MVIFSSSGFSMTTLSFTHCRAGRGSPRTSAGMSMAAPVFTTMALLLKNFRMVMAGGTGQEQPVSSEVSSGLQSVSF